MSGRVKAAVPVVTAPLVGSFGGSSTIQWHETEKTLAVAITATMPLSGGDVITLRLPQFQLPTNTSSSAVLELLGRSAHIFAAPLVLGGAGAGEEEQEGRGVWNDELNVLELRVRGVVGQVAVKEAQSVAIRVSFFLLSFLCHGQRGSVCLGAFCVWVYGGWEGGREGIHTYRERESESEGERVNSCACVCA